MPSSSWRRLLAKHVWTTSRRPWSPSWSRTSKAGRRNSPQRSEPSTKTAVRDRVLRDKVRIDGRGLTDIRALSAEVDILPRTHGSALFERGETQILGVTTLNMLRMEQLLDTLNPDNRQAVHAQLQLSALQHR